MPDRAVEFIRAKTHAAFASDRQPVRVTATPARPSRRRSAQSLGKRSRSAPFGAGPFGVVSSGAVRRSHAERDRVRRRSAQSRGKRSRSAPFGAITRKRSRSAPFGAVTRKEIASGAVRRSHAERDRVRRRLALSLEHEIAFGVVRCCHSEHEIAFGAVRRSHFRAIRGRLVRRRSAQSRGKRSPSAPFGAVISGPFGGHLVRRRSAQSRGTRSRSAPFGAVTRKEIASGAVRRRHSEHEIASGAVRRNHPEAELRRDPRLAQVRGGPQIARLAQLTVACG
jgi:hypothetical protein